ncbi:hypothetical protein GCM10007919_40180 [Rhizobium indigoferae]|nr:hypothetical protein GCM10007919_40180 [Rhizobium indigoferae]
MVPVSMRLPIANSVAEFGELLVDAFYVSDDFVPSDQMMEADGARNLWWNINDLVSIRGRLPVAPTNEYTVSGRSGSCLPVALNMMPSHFGFWQNDYFHIGLSFPGSFNFDSALSVDFGDGSGSFTSGGERVGVWKTWNDDWVPTYPVDGHVRSGVITEVGRRFLDRFAQKSNMRLGWRVTLKVWRAGDYGSHRPMERFAHFVMP